MQLKQINGKSKKTGKEYTAYCVTIGEYRTPLFFPSKIELMYIKSYLQKMNHGAFKDSDDSELPEDEDNED